MISQAVILCGGEGTRLGDLTREFPKPLLPIRGEPLLDRSIRLLAEQGFNRVLLAAGFRADLIVDHYRQNPIPGVEVSTVIEEESLGTSGCLRLLAGELDENFLLVYGDVFLDLDCRALAEQHEENGVLATLLVRQSDHPWDSDLVDADDNGRVRALLPRSVRDPDGLYRNIGNAALYVLSRRMLSYVPEGRKSDFCRDVFPAALAAGERLRSYVLPDGQWCRDMGTPDRLGLVERYLEQQQAIARARRNPKPIDTVLIDRDGTLNVQDMTRNDGFVTCPEELELLPGAAEGIGLMKEAGMRVFVLTNQPGIARGLYDFEMLEAIHRKLAAEIAAGGGGATLDGIYFSPYHPETEHPGGVREFRRASECRKPGIGMIMQAVDEHGIDLAATCMIGDSWRDIRAGRNAGLRTILVENLKDADRLDPDQAFPNLLEAAQHLVSAKALELTEGSDPT